MLVELESCESFCRFLVEHLPGPREFHRPINKRHHRRAERSSKLGEFVFHFRWKLRMNCSLVMRELCNAFVRRGPQPGVPQMLRTYRRVRGQVDEVMRVAGATSLFEARVFKDLCFVTRAVAQQAAQ
jgi:hypothetical protein